MINIRIYPVTEIETNCCYLVDEATGKSAVVDPGGNSEALLRQIEADGGNLDYVILTHGHYDHICYAKQLAEKFNAQIITGRHNAEFLKNPDLNGALIEGFPFEPFEADILLDDGETIKLGETEIEYLYTPGHTSGCGVFIFDDVIICGDLLFYRSYGRTDLPTGDDSSMIRSLKRLKSLDGDYTVIPGHGPVTTLEAERRFNPLMRRL